MAYPDYTQWDPWDVDFATANPDLAAMYESGQTTLSPYDIFLVGAETSSDWTVTDAIKQDIRAQLGLTKQDYMKYVDQWKYDQRALNRYLVETGQAEQYELDPTPWDDTLTPQDVEDQQLWYDIYLDQKEKDDAAAARKAELEAIAEAAAAQEEEDIATIGELAGLRTQSEDLAIADVNEYIDETEQRMKLRGVGTNFTEGVRQEMINSRMSEYWSEENETLLSDLLSKYQDSDYELPVLSDRVLYGGEPNTNTASITEAAISPTNVGSATEQYQAALTAAMASSGAASTLLTATNEDKKKSLLSGSSLLG